MVYKANVRPAWVVLVLLLIFTLAYALVKTTDTPIADTLMAEQAIPEKVDLSRFKNAEDNEKCLNLERSTFSGIACSPIRVSAIGDP